MNQQNVPGKGSAIGSLVCGILSIVFSFFSISSIIGLILGIVGLVLANDSKKAGYNDGLRTGGFVVSLIGVILSSIFFVSCVACVGCLSAAGSLSALSY